MIAQCYNRFTVYTQRDSGTKMSQSIKHTSPNVSHFMTADPMLSQFVPTSSVSHPANLAGTPSHADGDTLTAELRLLHSEAVLHEVAA